MKKKKVLAVDDELDMRIYLSTLLENNGYESIVAREGKEGIQMVREKKPHLVILDILMPEESGVKMYRELKTDHNLKDIPVLILSAISKKTFTHSQKVLDEFKGKSVPEPEAYIEKPPDSDELLETIGKLLS
ncbi:MAG TPA: response regulator [Syntrophaceae bacterium]|nr:response regulator [Syntrophaceae bacterium]